MWYELEKGYQGNDQKEHPTLTVRMGLSFKAMSD